MRHTIQSKVQKFANVVIIVQSPMGIAICYSTNNTPPRLNTMAAGPKFQTQQSTSYTRVSLLRVTHLSKRQRMREGTS